MIEISQPFERLGDRSEAPVFVLSFVDVDGIVIGAILIFDIDLKHFFFSEPHADAEPVVNSSGEHFLFEELLADGPDIIQRQLLPVLVADELLVPEYFDGKSRHRVMDELFDQGVIPT